MADFPNVIDLMFGRIDRNTDTQYRDKALQQNQNQFTSQLDADRERTRIAHDQFMKNLGLQTDQFNNQKTQQGFANNLTVNEAVAKGLFKPIAIQQQGVMPGNMFMRNPGAIPSVDNGDPTMGPGFEFNGGRYQPVNQRDLNLKTLLDQKQVERKFKDEDEQYQIQQFTKHLKVDPFTARLMVTNPQMIAHVVGSNNIVGLLSLAGQGVIPPSVIDTVIKNMGSQTATQAEAGETDSMRAMRTANITQSNAQAGLANAQSANLVNANKGEALYNEASAAVSRLGINASDPRYIGAVRSYIDSRPVDASVKAAASSVATRDLNPRTLGQNFLGGLLEQSNQAGKNPQTPSYPVVPQATPTVTSPGDTSRPSGAMPAVVNNKTPDVTGPRGNTNQPAPLRYTQPSQEAAPDMGNLTGQFFNLIQPRSAYGQQPNETVMIDPITKQPIYLNQQPNMIRYPKTQPNNNWTNPHAPLPWNR